MAAVSVQRPTDVRDVFTGSMPTDSLNAIYSDSQTPSDADILRDIASVCAVPVEAIEDLYPCAPLQVGIIAQPIERIYINCVYATLAPSFDLDRFCGALRHVHALNPLLRTRIVDSELGLVQVVLREDLIIAGPALKTSDTETEHKDELQMTLWREKSTPMRMGQPLFRAALVGRTIVLTTHHAVADGGNYHILFDNLSRVYHGQSLAPHAEFKLFVKHCYSIDPAAATAFWSPRFSGHSVAFPVMDVDVMPDARIMIKTNISLDSTLHEAPVGLMPSYVETAWAVTAMSYTGAESVLFGRVLSERSPSFGEFGTTMGPVIVTMPVQANLSQTATVGALIRERAQERREALNSPVLQYGLVGLRDISDAAKRAARFTTLLNFRTPTEEGVDYVSPELEIHGEYEPHLPFGLGISLVWNGKGLSVETLYDPDIVCERQTRRILRQFEHVLGLLLQMPAGTRLGSLALLNAQDRREMIGWNRLGNGPVKHTLHYLFRVQVRKQADFIAVQGPECQLTYGELDGKSDAVAHGLRRRGVGREESVALIFDKSVWAVVAQLAVLKAGAVCVPIDPSFPAARKTTIIDGSGAKMVLTGGPFGEMAADWKGTVWVLGDEQISLVEAANGYHETDAETGNRDDGISPSQAAFILFTSGSTGTPKGHVLEHRNLVSSLTAIGQAMALGPDTRMLQFAAYVWDMSIAETHGTLLAGGCVCVPSEEARESAMAEYMTTKGVNTAIFTPTVLRLLTPSETPALKTIMSIGEPVDLDSADAWAAAGCRFFNAWGPSETACVSAMAELTLKSSYRGNIGRPLASATWLVDPRDADASRLVPVGAVGEIVVEGQGVARGYLNAPQQTAASFIDPPGWAPSRRGTPRKMYRTGDLAKYNPDGSLQYIGRQDNQVKVNGQRVELGEVERALGSCEGVQQAVCVTQVLPGEGNRKSLVAIVVLDVARLQAPPQALRELASKHEPFASQTLETLRRLLSARLPPYMIPSVWKVVEDLPRTTSLKIDRSSIKKWLIAQLKSEDGSGRDTEGGNTDSLTVPVSPAEFCLRAAWALALGLHESEVGRESAFIKLGGDSILAISVATLCRKKNLRVSVATLLRSKSLAEVAEKSHPVHSEKSHSVELERMPASDPNPQTQARTNGVNGTSGSPEPEQDHPPCVSDWKLADMPTIQPLLDDTGVDPSDIEAVLPCSPLQQDVTLSQVKERGSAYWMKLTFKLTPALDGEVVDQQRLAQAWKALCAKQPILRTIIVSHDSDDSAFQQIILKHAPVSVSTSELGRLGTSSADVISALAAIVPPDLMTRRPQHHLHMSPMTGSIVYVTVFINHALFDERSVHILADQLSAAYRDSASLRRGPSLAAYLRRVQESKDETRRHWKKYLSGAEPCIVPELTQAEAQLRARSVSDVCCVPITSPPEKLTLFCVDRGITLANLMQLAWGVVLRVCTGCESPLFGYLQSHAGWLEDGDDMMGPLLAMAYCRLRPAGPDSSLDQLLRVAHEESLQALDCGACSVSQLHEDLGVGSSSLFNTIMTIYRFPARKSGDTARADGGLDMEHLPLAGHNEYLMTLGVAYNNTTLHSGILFDPARAAPSFVNKIAALLSKIVDGIVQDSQQSLASLETTVLPEVEELPLFSPLQDMSRSALCRAAARCDVGTSRIQSVYPCTPLQAQQMRVAVASNESDLDQYMFSFDSSVSTKQARDAWEHVIEAYPVLRSRVVSLCDESDEQGACCVTLRDSTGIISDSEESLEDYLVVDRERPVRHGRPLCRVGLVPNKDCDGLSSSVLSIHRSIYDPWTISLIERALGKACAGEPIENNQSCAGLLGNRTCREAAALRLIKDKSVRDSARDSTEAPQFPRSPPGHSTVVRLSRQQSSRTEQSVDSKVLHAAWVLTLARITGDSNVACGVYVAGRGGASQTPDMLEVAGPVGAVHAFSVDLRSAPTAVALLDLVSQWEVDALSSAPPPARENVETDRSKAANVLIVDQSSALVLSPGQGSKRSTMVTRGSKPGEGLLSLMAPLEDVFMVMQCAVDEAGYAELDLRFDERAISPGEASLLIAQYQHSIYQLSSPSTTTTLAELPALSSHETTLLRQWTRDLPAARTSTTADVGECVHDRISRHARTQKLAQMPAVCSWDGDLDYGQLDELSGRLSAYIKEQVVGPDAFVVPYFVDKSVVAVVVMLGILKAGGTLLPLDSNHPVDRLQAIVKESNSSMVLVVSRLYNKVQKKMHSSSGGKSRLVEVNMEMIRGLALPTTATTPNPVSTSTLCYIIYTSGSSGKPKGVMVTHANLTASAHAVGSLINMHRGTRTLQYLNFIFDVAMFDVFLTLLAGGCVCLPSETEWSADMAGAIRRTRANFVFLTPSLASLLDPAEVPTLDTLGLTGEACEAHVVHKWRHLDRVLNMYGPAEATVHSSGADVSLRTGRSHLNIGRSSRGGCVYWAVDPDHVDRLVPVGCPGELLIYGPIVAKGYLGDPVRTAAAFIEPPAWAGTMGVEPGHRWYKTGDLVVQQASDGSMAYLGRKDTQVKLSGQRIELGEIEHHLRRSLAVHSCRKRHVGVEVVQSPGRGHEQDKALVVFLADADQDTGGVAATKVWPSPLGDEAVVLSDMLAKSLPPYMVPRFFICLDKLPMTSSGKLDRAALRKLGGSMSPAELGRYSSSRAGPSSSSLPLLVHQDEDKTNQVSELEDVLRRLWSEGLAIPEEGILTEDDFFSLGGSSIRATRLAHAARRAGIDLKVALIFSFPTLRGMASKASWRSDCVATRGSNNKDLDRDNQVDHELNPATTADQLAKGLTKHILADADFMQACRTHASQRLGLSRLTADDVSSVAVATDTQADMLAVGELDGSTWRNSMRIDSPAGLEVAALLKACAAVVRHRELLRTTMVQYRQTLYQVVLGPGVAAKAAPAVLTVAAPATGWSDGPSADNDLARFHIGGLQGEGPEQRCHRLVLQVHHAHYDALAMDMILDDLRDAYQTYTCSNSEDSEDDDIWQPHPTRPSFHALVAHVGSLDVTAARRFWSSALEGSSSMTRMLPAPVVSPVTPHPCVDSVRIRVPMSCVELSSHQTLGSLGTPSSVVQAAWSLVLARATGHQDIVFAAPHASRDVPGFPDADRVPGLCLNFVPARARVAPTPGGANTFASLVRQMQDFAVAAIPHRHLGFRTIIRECSLWPAATRYGSVLIYQNHESLRPTIRFGADQDCQLTPQGNFGRCADMLVEATPHLDDGDCRELIVDLYLSRRSFTDPQVAWIAQTLEAILLAIPTGLDLPIDEVGNHPSGNGGTSTAPPYPFPSGIISGSRANTLESADVSAHSQTNGYLDHTHDAPALKLVREAWSRVGLDPVTAKTTVSGNDNGCGNRDCSMFDDMSSSKSSGAAGGGDLITTLLLAREYQRIGYPFRMQQIIDNPTVSAQARLVASAPAPQQ